MRIRVLGGSDGHPALCVGGMAVCTPVEGDVLVLHWIANCRRIDMERLHLDDSEDGATNSNRA